MGIRKGDPVRGAIHRMSADLQVGDTWEFQYNPTQIRRGRGVNWTLQIPPGGYTPIPMFGSGTGETISLELFIDSRENLEDRNHVMRALSFYESLTLPSSLEGEEFDDLSDLAPPLCMLQLGGELGGTALRQWWVVCTNVAIVEELFDLNLTPIRARVTVDLAAVIDADKQQRRLRDLLAVTATATKKGKAPVGAPSDSDLGFSLVGGDPLFGQSATSGTVFDF